MTEPRTEAQLQRRIVKEIKRRWPKAWVIHPVGGPFQVPGLPDLLVCVKGLLFGLEVKFAAPGESHNHAVERATPQQRNQIRLINAAGGQASVVTDVEGAIDLIERALARLDHG